MSFFRRDKDADKDAMEEFRRARQALGRPPTGNVVGAPTPEPPTNDHSRPASAMPEPPRPAHSEAAAPTVQAKAEDSLEKYRQGATTVAKDTSFKGALKSDSNLCIEGNFDGELEARATIFIAPSANVKADVVRANDVIVAGTLNGTVDAGSRFHAMPSARVSGEINSSILVIEQGSHVNCRFVMKGRQGGQRR